MNKKGFALLEIVVVIAIVALFAGGGFYMQTIRNQKTTIETGLDAQVKALDLKRQVESRARQEEQSLNQVSGALHTSSTEKSSSSDTTTEPTWTRTLPTSTPPITLCSKNHIVSSSAVPTYDDLFNGPLECLASNGLFIVSKKPLALQGYPSKMVVLWMINPEPLEYIGEACPAPIGEGWRGITRISLLDQNKKEILNTVPVSRFNFPNKDSFELYYQLEPDNSGFLSPTIASSGKVSYLNFLDHNDDGKPLEFILFDHENCHGMFVRVIGYSIKQDKIIDYLIQYGNHTNHWIISDWSSSKPARQQYWEFANHEFQREGCDIREAITYDPDKEMFYSKEISRVCEPQG